MALLRSRGFRICSLCVLVVLTLFQVKRQWTQETQASKDQSIPLEGKVPEIDTAGKVPGDPANAIEDMKLIHSLVGIYRAKHGGNPKTCNVLLEDIDKRPKDYGMKSQRQAAALFLNPDTRYSDLGFMRNNPNNSFPYTIYTKRLDGTPYGGPKAPGTRDISVMTDLYAHKNIRHFKGSRSTSNPVGFYIVMWDDGQVEKIPYDKELFVPLPNQGDGFKRHAFALPGQAGVPTGALTYDEFYKKIGWKRAPRGEVGGKGRAYDTP